ncbi:MAG TPA: dienelactone hydrolase family protein [Longimicrobiales bacterium]
MTSDRIRGRSAGAFALAAALCLATPAATRAQDHSAHAEHREMDERGTQGVSAAAQEPGLPPGAAAARARLEASPRHGEWVMVKTGPADSVRAWVVYPERAERAPVVVVVHEIYGLTHWVRAVADQLAADGFIAIAPDLLTTKNIPAGEDGDPEREAAVSAIRTLEPDDIHRQLRAIAEYGMALPAATRRYGIVGFCWGGGVSFAHAVRVSELGAAVVYYGTSPDPAELGAVRAPVLGLYGGKDARVNATVPPADSAMKALGKTFEYSIFPGAGHGFLRQQDGQGGANLAAAREAWPKTVQWFRQHLEGEAKAGS